MSLDPKGFPDDMKREWIDPDELERLRRALKEEGQKADTRLQDIADVWNGENMAHRMARTKLYDDWPVLARSIDIAVGEGLPKGDSE